MKQNLDNENKKATSKTVEKWSENGLEKKVIMSLISLKLISIIVLFLVADTRLYTLLCRSVGSSVGYDFF